MTENLPIVHSVGFSFGEMQMMAKSIAGSGLFGIKTPDQALTLMLVSQAEGRHPVLAARDYDIIQGKPAKKAEAMQRDFQASGGKIEWHELSDTNASATFSHPQGGSVKIDWDIARAQRAGLIGKENWKKFARAMMRSRCVSEGVRTVLPAATSGMYVPEEMHDIHAEMVDVTPRHQPHDEITGEIIPDEPRQLETLKEQGHAHARLGKEELERWFVSLDRPEKRAIKSYLDETLKQEAIVADNRALDHSDRDPETLPGANEHEAQAPLAPEQPAVDPQSGDSAVPPAEDNFGLRMHPDEAFCREVLSQIEATTLVAGWEQVNAKLYDGRNTWCKRKDKLPEQMWNDLLAKVTAHHEKLLRAQEAMA